MWCVQLAFSIINSLDTQKLGFFAVQSITKLINRKELKGNRSDCVIKKCEVLIKVSIKDPFHKMRAETKKRVIISLSFKKRFRLSPVLSCIKGDTSTTRLLKWSRVTCCPNILSSEHWSEILPLKKPYEMST